MSDEGIYNQENTALSAELSEMLRNADLEAHGVSQSEKRPYLVGLLTGVCLGHGFPNSFVKDFITHPTTQAMLASLAEES